MKNASKTAVVFPGQGSQSVGMLERFWNNASVQKIFARAEDVLQYDLLEIIKTGPLEKLNQTQITQPALLVSSVALWTVWQEQRDISPVAFVGHSLGEYTALVCSGVLSFEDSVTLVSNRGHYMQEAVPSGAGAMAAIVGLSLDDINQLCQEAVQGKIDEIVSAANINAPGQIVIAGHVQAVERAIALAKLAGAKLIKKLDVSVPSHCALMKPAAEKLGILLEKICFNQPQIPVFQNSSGKYYTNTADIKQALFDQLYCPVQWVESIENMVNHFSPDSIIECGPGKVLAGLNKRITPVPTRSVEEIISHV